MNESYDLEIRIFESYTNYANGDTLVNTCAVDSGYVHIVDDIGGGLDDNYTFSDGMLEYTSFAGRPNTAGGEYHPYQKNIQVTAYSDYGQPPTIMEWAIVTGNSPSTNHETSTSPTIPLMILRDPPGDASYTSWTTAEEYSFATSIATVHNDEIGIYVNDMIGVDLTTSAGFGVEVEYEVDITLDFGVSQNVSVSNTDAHEQVWTLSTEEILSTSANGDFVGQGGDVYVGTAINMIKGITLVLDVTDGVLSLHNEIVHAPIEFLTDYYYSESEILDDVIPSLEAQNDTVSIALWENILAMNQMTKDSATFMDTISFDSGVIRDQTRTNVTTETITFEYESEISEEFALAAGLTINGVGIEEGLTISTALTVGMSTSDETSFSNTMSYHLEDDDYGDNFSLNIKWDNLFGTPVFDLISGDSSRPWEEGTNKRNNPTLQIIPQGPAIVPPDEAAEFTIIIGNQSESQEDRDYRLRLVSDSNPYGAELVINGSSLGSGYVLYNDVPYKNDILNTLWVSKNQNSNE
jgi:hypothetical protein